MTDHHYEIAGIVVLHDPVHARLDQVNHLAGLVGHLYLVDNTPAGFDALTALGQQSSLTIIVNRNKGGLAGAYNNAIERIGIEQPNTTHILFLDEDSDIAALSSFLDSPVTHDALAQADVAAVAPLYVEKATGLPGAHIQLRRFTYRVLPRELTEATEVSFLINSMSLWAYSAIKKIGQHSTVLGVDHVDTDYCLRANQLGYRLILNPTVRFQHTIGARKAYRLFGRTLQSGGHSPARREMIGRNTAILAKRFALYYPSFVLLCISRICYECLGIIIIENKKLKKLTSTLKGTATGLYTKYHS